MKYGIKLWSTNSKHLFQATSTLITKKEIAFAELYITDRKIDKKFLRPLKKGNISIHAPHESEGINLAQVKGFNNETYARLKEIAQFLQATTMIVHPGIDGQLNILKNNLKRFRFKNLLIENMPLKCLKELKGHKCRGATIEELKKILSLGYQLCLDFGHAIKASISQKIPYKKYIQELLLLNPRYFHLCDGTLSNPYDEHLNLGEGEYDLKWIKKILTKVENPYIVFETPKEGNSLDNDLRNIEYFKSL